MQVMQKRQSLDIDMRDTKIKSVKNSSIYWIASVTFVFIMALKEYSVNRSPGDEKKAALYIFRSHCCQGIILIVLHF